MLLWYCFEWLLLQTVFIQKTTQMVPNSTGKVLCHFGDLISFWSILWKYGTKESESYWSGNLSTAFTINLLVTYLHWKDSFPGDNNSAHPNHSTMNQFPGLPLWQYTHSYFSLFHLPLLTSSCPVTTSSSSHSWTLGKVSSPLTLHLLELCQRFHYLHFSSSKKKQLSCF